MYDCHVNVEQREREGERHLNVTNGELYLKITICIDISAISANISVIFDFSVAKKAFR